MSKIKDIGPPGERSADAGSPAPHSPKPLEREALFLAAPHCQGGHSEAGESISRVLGVPFPLRMTDLIAKLRTEGENPAIFYPWLIRAHGAVHRRGRHPFFTDNELEAARAGSRVAAPVDQQPREANHDDL